VGVEKQFAAIEGVSSVTRRTGRAERDEHAEPVSSSEIEVTMKPGVNQDAVRAEIDRIIANIPGITTMVGQPIEHRLSHVLSGTPAAIAINVYGDDLNVLRRSPRRSRAIKAIPGTRDVAANREVMITSLPIRYRAGPCRGGALARGSAPSRCSRRSTARRVAEVNQGVRGTRWSCAWPRASGSGSTRSWTCSCAARAARSCGLREVADIGPEKTSNLIARENAQRKAVISTNVADGYNLGQLVAQVQAKVDPIVQKRGVHRPLRRAVRGPAVGEPHDLHHGRGRGGLHVPAAATLHGQGRVALLVMLNLPLALIGGIARST
jgi:Cu/Ag efflux pump CusA